MKERFQILILLVSLSCILFLQFYNLGKLPIIQWDESRLAVNAAEMSRSKDYLVTTFEHKPDLYNTKPPLMIWLQVLSIKVFGLNEFAIRMPSSLAGFITILLTGWFVYRLNSNVYASSLAMLILASCDGFIQLHGSMTGDYDALLTLFILAGIYCGYKYLSFGDNRFFYLFIFFTALSLMTKSAAALIFYPVYFALFFYLSKFNHLTKLSLGLILALLPFILFCVLREQAEKGYLDAIWNNDFGGRFTGGKDGHEGEWYYYIVHLFTFRFNWFIWCLPPAIIWGIFKRSRELNFVSIILIIYLLIISIAKTKLEWYDIPVLSFISILISLFLFECYRQLQSKPYLSVFTMLIVVLITWSTYVKFKFIVSGEGRRLSMEIYTISEKLRMYKGYEKLTYYSGTYDAWNYFYTLANPVLERVEYNHVKIGQRIITDQVFSDSLNQRYRLVTLDSCNYCKTIQVTGIR